MGLQYPVNWRFTPPADGKFINSEVPPEAVRDFFSVIDRIGNQADRWAILEHFKKCYMVSTRSSSIDWAESDLSRAMNDAAKTAPLFIESFANACEQLAGQGIAVPDASLLNKILAKHRIGYEIRLPDLILLETNPAPIPVAVETMTLAEQVKEKVAKSLHRSNELLTDGRPREALQEVLWVLESVVNGFDGLEINNGRISGGYFTKILGDIRLKRKGTALTKVIEWITQMHGYLSSPTGGGVRHGADLVSGIDLDMHEARLFCNLTRSYILFLLDEHQSLTKEASK